MVYHVLLQTVITKNPRVKSDVLTARVGVKTQEGYTIDWLRSFSINYVNLHKNECAVYKLWMHIFLYFYCNPWFDSVSHNWEQTQDFFFFVIVCRPSPNIICYLLTGAWLFVCKWWWVRFFHMKKEDKTLNLTLLVRL